MAIRPGRPWRERRLEIAVFAAGILAGILIFWYAHEDVGDVATAKTQGQAVVAALESYRAQEGEYPESLDALVPEYLPEIEPPEWGTGEWRYRRYVAASPRRRVAASESPDTTAADTTEYLFELTVPENETGFPVLYWDRVDERWVLNR